MTTYAIIRRSNRNGGETTIARDIESLAEAAEAALRLLHLQESELGGADEFIVQPY
jgi:hypothetical protein